MKKTVLLSIVALAVNAFGQPVIVDGTNLPSPGFSAPGSMATPSGGVSVAGANQTWDFSALSFTPIGTLSVITPSSSPIGGSFPTANYAYSFASTYSFFNASATKMEVQAFSITTPGTGNDFTPNPRTILQFPFNYLDVVADTWQKVGGSTNNVTLTYDGYGTLKTPTDIYTNVVRVKEDYGSGAIDYQWYILNPLMSVMTYDHNSNTLYSIGATQTTGISENSPQSSISIYPNPVTDFVTIQMNNNTVGQKYSVMNVSGKEVLNGILTNEMTIIDLKEFASGIYFIRTNELPGGTFKVIKQ